MLREYPLAERVDFNLPSARHSGAFKSEIHSAYTGEQATKGHAVFLRAFPLALPALLARALPAITSGRRITFNFMPMPP